MWIEDGARRLSRWRRRTAHRNTDSCVSERGEGEKGSEEGVRRRSMVPHSYAALMTT